MRNNRVKARGLTGFIKDDDIEIKIGKEGGECKLLINGEPPRRKCEAIWIKIYPNIRTSITLEFTKYEKTKEAFGGGK